MIVLGIDPGTASTGFGVISAEGSTLRALDHGLISTPARAQPSRRMGEIHSRVAALIEQHAPEAVAMEDLFVGVNPRAVLSVGQARLQDSDIHELHEREPLLLREGAPLSQQELATADGLFLSLDLRGDDNGRVGHRAREYAPPIEMGLVDH